MSEPAIGTGGGLPSSHLPPLSVFTGTLAALAPNEDAVTVTAANFNVTNQVRHQSEQHTADGQHLPMGGGLLHEAMHQSGIRGGPV